jgi:hypothetical protein
MEQHNKFSIANYIELISNLAQDFEVYNDKKNPNVPNKLTYNITIPEESPAIKRSARLAALSELSQPAIKKLAFDTRRIDQEHSRNPRENLQYWQRSDQFIDDEMQEKIDIFAKLIKPMDEIKKSFGAQPEWHSSYARTLHESLYRILRIKEADLDIFRPQVAYLEQLMFARYRLSMEELARIKESDFKDIILKKDESLLKRGAYLHMTKDNEPKEIIIKDSNSANMQQNIVNAIFGNNDFRKDGERSCVRTITITIKDEVGNNKKAVQ